MWGLSIAVCGGKGRNNAVGGRCRCNRARIVRTHPRNLPAQVSTSHQSSEYSAAETSRWAQSVLAQSPRMKAEKSETKVKVQHVASLPDLGATRTMTDEAAFADLAKRQSNFPDASGALDFSPVFSRKRERKAD